MLLRQSPGLKSILPESIATAYADALDLACKETGLPPETFPMECPYPAAQILDDDYYPGSRESMGRHD